MSARNRLPIARRSSAVLRLLNKHHYLKGLKAVGERIFLRTGGRKRRVARSGRVHGRRAAAASPRRVDWLERRATQTTPASCRQQCPLPAFAHKTVPNLGSVALKLLCDRLSDDWMEHYGHPVAMVETFVDPARFSGTVYTAAGWVELGSDQLAADASRVIITKDTTGRNVSLCGSFPATPAAACRPTGSSLCSRRSKRRRSPRFTQSDEELCSLKERFHKRGARLPRQTLPLSRARLADDYGGGPSVGVAARDKRISPSSPKGSRKSQRRSVGIRRRPGSNRYGAPDQSSFQPHDEPGGRGDRRKGSARLAGVHSRGRPRTDEIIAIDGKIPAHSGGKNIVTAITSPSQHYLGCTVTAEGTNEITAARGAVRED